ncbi:MAG: hypothetical protein HYT28_00530 [Parcubacteria group bacterium]|nr:hypothetical protein [Parcubacteria group bacterium]
MLTTFSLRQRIMRRVYAVWILKNVVRPLLIKGSIAVAFIWEMKQTVSLRHVFANIPNPTDMGAVYNFFSYAFTHTETAVQVLSFALAALGLWMIRDVFSSFKVSEPIAIKP